jgi:hypothetical protein
VIHVNSETERTLRIIAAVIALAALAIGPALTGCGRSAPSTFTMHGAVTQLGGTAIGQGPCGPGNRKGGTTVNVVSPSGAELGQGTLGPPADTGHQSCGLPICRSAFTVTGLPSERLYGIRIEGCEWDELV